MKKYVSYSELQLWHRDPKEYVEHYVNGKESPQSREALLGNHIHSYIENEQYPFVEKMKEDKFGVKTILRVQKIYPKIPKNGEAEVPMIGDLEGIKLYAKFDRFDKKEKILRDYKTTSNVDRWKQYMVDNHKQFSFYSLIYYLNYFSFLREIELTQITIPDEKKKGQPSVHRFYTARSRKDHDEIKDWILTAVQEIKDAGIWEQRKSRQQMEYDKATKLL